MIIKRTPAAYQPTKGAVTIHDPWGGGESGMFADVVHASDYPTHSRVLGPDGHRLQYEPRPPIGFDLRVKS